MRVAVITVRDPDGDTTVQVYVNGKEVPRFVHYDIDPGRGYTSEDWADSRERESRHAAVMHGPTVGLAVEDAYDSQADSEFIQPVRHAS